MGALGGGGHGAFWGWRNNDESRPRIRRTRNCKPRNFSDSAGPTGSAGYQFPLRPAVTAGSLALAGDTIAQVQARFRKRKESSEGDDKVSVDSVVHFAATGYYTG